MVHRYSLDFSPMVCTFAFRRSKSLGRPLKRFLNDGKFATATICQLGCCGNNKALLVRVPTP